MEKEPAVPRWLCVRGLLVCLRMCVTYICAVCTTTYKYMSLRSITGCEQTHSCPQTRLFSS